MIGGSILILYIDEYMYNLLGDGRRWIIGYLLYWLRANCRPSGPAAGLRARVIRNHLTHGLRVVRGIARPFALDPRQERKLTFHM